MTTDGRDSGTPDPIRCVSYDPAFRPAIEAGCLTVRQALQRGRRDQCASSLSTRHGLTLELAFDVTDNRLTLAQALRQQRSPGDDPEERRAHKRSLNIAWLAFGAPLAVFLAAFLWFYGAAAPPEAAPTGPARVARDEAGRVTQVEADDAAGVLEAFCGAASSGASCESIGLLKATREAPGLRIGILADPGSIEKLLAIPIRRDRGSSRWSAGDGAAPLVPLLAPHNSAASLERGDSPPARSGPQAP